MTKLDCMKRNPGMPQLPGSHGGWRGKSACRSRSHSVPAGGRRSRRGGTVRDRRRTLRSSPSSSPVEWEDALQRAPAGRLFVPRVANTLWTKEKDVKKDVSTVNLPFFVHCPPWICLIFLYFPEFPLSTLWVHVETWMFIQLLVLHSGGGKTRVTPSKHTLHCIIVNSGCCQ